MHLRPKLSLVLVKCVVVFGSFLMTDTLFFIPPCAPELRSDCTRWGFHFKCSKRINNIEFRWVYGLWERNLSVSLQQSRPEERKSSIALVTDVRLIYLSVTAPRLSHNTHQSSNILCWSSLSCCHGEFSSFLLFSGFMASLFSACPFGFHPGLLLYLFSTIFI